MYNLHYVAKPDMPLMAYQEQSSFKIYMADVGLLAAKSLKYYCERYSPRYAVRTSMSDHREEDWLINVPLYSIGMIKELLDGKD